MRTLLSGRITLALIGSLSVGSLNTLLAQSPQYVVTDLQVGGSSSVAMAINRYGHVVGYRQLGWGTLPWAYRWKNGQVALLNVPGSVGAIAHDVNDHDQVAGTAHFTFPDRTTAVRWGNNGVASVLPEPAWSIPIGSEGTTITNAGCVGGNSWHLAQRENGSWGNVSRAICWPDESSYQLAGFYDFLSSTVAAGNSTAQFVGSTETRFFSEIQAFIWQGEAIINLEIGSSESYATGINSSSRVVGWYLWGYPRAFLWAAGSSEDLGMLPGGLGSRARAINESGVIIGETLYSGGRTEPCLWQGGHVWALNALVDPSSGWQLLTANDLNDAGQIVGSGYHNGQPASYLLTPLKTTGR